MEHEEVGPFGRSDTLRNEYIDFLRGIAAFGIVAIHTRAVRIPVRSAGNYFSDFDSKDDPSVCGPACHQYEYVRNLSVWGFRKLDFLSMCKPVFLLCVYIFFERRVSTRYYRKSKRRNHLQGKKKCLKI